VTVVIVSVSLTLHFQGNLEGDSTAKGRARSAENGEGGAAAFITNEEFINAVREEMDLANVDQVFRYVFSKLDDEIFIYPTENYYYFKFPAAGKEFWGSLHLPAHRLDEGLLGFGYIEKGNDINRTAVLGGSADYNRERGVVIEKIDDFSYSVTFENRSVLFKLNRLELKPPIKAKFMRDEIFVEPTFDESGLKFALVFNTTKKRLYWVLNEDGYVPESFTEHAIDLVIGDRTGFAFYLDRDNNRKVLVGVYGLNVIQNNWYDGPFDQLLDTQVQTGQVEIKKYLEAAYPSAKDRIDKFGNHLYDFMRMAIGSYSIYFFKEELVELLDSCQESETKNALLTCLTMEHHDRLLDPPYP
jgi:hypothetical protein